MLYYIHGYLSSPDGTKGSLLKNKLNVIPIKYRDCKPEELDISDSVNKICNSIKNDKKVILIGSSLGGLLAVKTALIQKNIIKLILINPAIIPPNVDINQIENMPKNILSDMKDVQLFNNRIDADITILLGTEDELLPSNWAVEFAKTQEANIKFYHDDHRFSKNLKNLPYIISNIINQKN